MEEIKDINAKMIFMSNDNYVENNIDIDIDTLVDMIPPISQNSKSLSDYEKQSLFTT